MKPEIVKLFEPNNILDKRHMTQLKITINPITVVPNDITHNVGKVVSRINQLVSKFKTWEILQDDGEVKLCYSQLNLNIILDIDKINFEISDWKNISDGGS